MRALPLLLLLAACSPETEPTTNPAPEPTTSALPPDPETVDAWTGAWHWDETWPGPEGTANARAYALVLGAESRNLNGHLAIDGYQTMADYLVRGEPRGDTLDVVLTGYGADNLREDPAVGDTLFSLVREDAPETEYGVSYRTVWGALRPALETDEQVAFETTPPDGDV